MKNNILYLASGRKYTGMIAHALNNLYYLEKYLPYNFSLATPCSAPWTFENVRLLTHLHHSYRGFHSFHIYQDLSALASYCRKHKISLIHTFKWYDLIVALLLKKSFFSDFIHIHSSETADIKALKAWQRFLIRKPYGIIFPGQLPSDSYLSGTVTDFLPPFIDPRLWSVQKHETGDNLNVLLVSKITEDKNWETFLDALSKIQRKDLHFLIFGKGAYLETLRRKSGKLAVNVSFLGHMDLQKAYQKADIGLILQTGSDGFCRTLFEFYVQNIPVIAPDYGIFRKIVRSVNKDALFTTPEELRKILEDVNVKTLNQWHQNLKTFKSWYQPEILSRQYQKFYDACLE